MDLVEKADGGFRVRGYESWAMLAASVVTLAGVGLLAVDRGPGRATVLAVIVGSVAVVMVLAVRRIRQDGAVSTKVGALIERQRHTEAVNRLDALTGTLNRAHFLESFNERMRGGAGRTGIALLLIDIDRFKWVNDSFGHDMGDAILAHVGRALTTQMPDALVGRLGGDEFAVAIAGPVSERTCAWVGERILEALNRPVRLLQRTMRTDATIGVAWAPEHATTAEDLISSADLALYEAKRAGRRCVRVFDAGLLKRRKYDAYIARELRAAVLLDHLEVHYQPIVALPAGEITGFEALVRWRHPVRGLIPPGEFVPIAETSSLIELLGDWVLRRACLDSHSWPADVRIGVNVSPKQLQRPGFAENVIRILAESAVDPRRIVMEITENVLLECTDRHREQLDTLRARGIRLSLDDFGTGHSSLRYLRDFTFDSLKIDRDFVRDLGQSETNRTFVTAIAHIGRGLNMTVVGEGVETEKQKDMLHAAGCAYAQGFLFATPMPAAEATSLLRKNRASARRCGEGSSAAY